MAAIAILGGTGAEGVGLALRFAQIGEEVVIGSRDANRAAEAARRVATAVSGARVGGAENAAAAEASERIVLALPHAGVEAFLAQHAPAMRGKLVIDVMVPLRFAGGWCVSVPVAEGSLGELIQQRAPQARVVSAFKNLAAEHLQRVDEALEGDVLLCGDDDAAKKEVAALAERIPKLRAIDAGPLSGAAGLERLTVMQLNINRLHRAVTAVRILGLS